jgi:hypothetical protein
MDHLGASFSFCFLFYVLGGEKNDGIIGETELFDFTVKNSFYDGNL